MFNLFASVRVIVTTVSLVLTKVAPVKFKVEATPAVPLAVNWLRLISSAHVPPAIVSLITRESGIIFVSLPRGAVSICLILAVVNVWNSTQVLAGLPVNGAGKAFLRLTHILSPVLAFAAGTFAATSIPVIVSVEVFGFVAPGNITYWKSVRVVPKIPPVGNANVSAD
jgi:hypothetical protein